MPNVCLQLVDAHAGGDVSRQIVGGVETLPGETLLEQLEYLADHADGLRQLLLNEPYGNPSMSVNLVVKAIDSRAEAGFITMEAMGYPYFSGSNTLCTAATLLRREFERSGRKEPAITLETPAGLVAVTAEYREDLLYSVTCKTTPAYVVEQGLCVTLPVYGEVRFDLIFSGALYAVVRSEPLGLVLDHHHEPRLIAFASELITQARPLCEHFHPEMGLLAPLPFVHFAGPESQAADGKVHTSTATYVHPGVICRSPTGTGISARLALKHQRGLMSTGDGMSATSPRGNSFDAIIAEETNVGDYPGVICSVTGRVFFLADSNIWVDLSDPHVPKSGLQIVEGFNNF